MCDATSGDRDMVSVIIPSYNRFKYLLKAIENFKNSNSNFHLIGNYFNGVSVSDCIQKSRELVKIIN